MFDEPTGWELPPKGFEVKDNGYLAPESDGSHVKVVVNEESERLQLLSPFKPIGNKITGAPVILLPIGLNGDNNCNLSDSSLTTTFT